MQDSSSTSSLSRYSLNEEHLILDSSIREEIASAFNDNRAFHFIPDQGIIDSFKAGASYDDISQNLINKKNDIINLISSGNNTLSNRLHSDARFISNLVSALFFIHKGIVEADLTSLLNRRFVLVRERSGSPTIYHISNETTVISHIGTGPEWGEIPSIYLGLNIFDVLVSEQSRNENSLFQSFKDLLMIESRAIETGYAHTEIFPSKVSRGLNRLVDEILKISLVEKAGIIEKKKELPLKKFLPKNRNSIINLLDARMSGNEMNFDFSRNLKGLLALEKYSRRYKKNSDKASLREIIRLLVAASGHDIHEIRNTANILLERIFSPKEFDAPPAERFINARIGSNIRLEFDLDKRSEYYIRLYNPVPAKIANNPDSGTGKHKLHYDKNNRIFYVELQFDKPGHYDFLVIKKKKKDEWLNSPGTSGRINVMPDLRGEIILEIFPDIHGHTGLFWKDGSGHPGLVYNEHGEIIRLGTFRDIAAHLEYMKQNYFITSIYLLGVQRRGRNREDWAPGASSPSPFSPLSLTKIEESLGGEQGLKDLIQKAHSLGIKIIIDIIPHLNRRSDFPGELVVKCYNNEGKLVDRASTDGRFGSWDDGRLHNYRMFEVWEWLADSVCFLIEEYDIDGIRFDSAHAVPIMMKKNNYPFENSRKRTHEEMLEGRIIVNDREDNHFITTGYYDSACRDTIAVPFHYYLMLRIREKLTAKDKTFFINIAECYWGHEKFLARTGIVPFNSALFKICENIIHGRTDVREIYHIYDNYFPAALPEGTDLLGILGNHDERRALNTFGHRGLRAAVALTLFISNIVMDYEGSAEGEGWKVYLDNIYVNWNMFENASHRSVYNFYREWYSFHRQATGRSFLIWSNNNMSVGAVRFADDAAWIGVFNFSDSNQNVSLQFDNPNLPLDDNAFFIITDPMYSQITGISGFFTGEELKTSRVNTVVNYTERIKLLKLERTKSPENFYGDFLNDSFRRLCRISETGHIKKNFAFKEISASIHSYDNFISFISTKIIPYVSNNDEIIELGIKRSLFHIYINNVYNKKNLLGYISKLPDEDDLNLRKIGDYIKYHNRTGNVIFLSAEAEPFSKSGGLANVVYELPREMAKKGENVFVITPYYRKGDDKAVKKIENAVRTNNIKYTGINVNFKIQDREYSAGVHYGTVDGINYYLLEHHEFFDGLYWGITSYEKIVRRIAFARSAIELIIKFELNPFFTFTNDAFAGLFNGILRSDPFYINNPNFKMNKFMHLIHNGGWQYFDSFHFFEKGFNLFHLFNLPAERYWDFSDPVHHDRLNCMAAGIRFADKVITVSPSYALQIERACDGLEHILKNVLGISNALGKDFKKRIYTRFKASGFHNKYEEMTERIAADDILKKKINDRYPEILKNDFKFKTVRDARRKNILKRILNKLTLQNERGFRTDPDIPLLCMIHRISEQKGFQLLLEASEGIFKKLGCQFIVGGAVSSGDKRGEEIAHGLYLLNRYYPDRMSASFGFQDVSVPLMSCDYFCMPSMSEPGGISQLEAFACGCLVVARATGGLRDTVFPISIRNSRIAGNGFLFTDFSPWAFYDSVERACDFLKNDDDVIYKARVNAENSVNYWDKPAEEYIKRIYEFREVIR